MNGRTLAGLLGPLLGIEARPALRALVTGQSTSISMRYDHVRDWAVMERLLSEFAPELYILDGEERFTIALSAGSTGEMA